VPLSQLALASHLGRAASTAAPILITLTAQGLSADHLAFFLDALASERDLSVRGDASVELVSTGPEPAGLPARDTRIVVRELFRKAEQSVVVAGYAVYRGRGDTSRASEILRRFADRFRSHEWPGSRMPEVYYDPRSLDLHATKRASLHAKCVVVDERVAFVSSANFTEAAQVRNIEVGALIHSETFARQLAGHFTSLAEQNHLSRLPGI
jgi:phosphatidylserine/phosphatidylglycerophosphate/cardiolipin synthase-like enzyme